MKKKERDSRKNLSLEELKAEQGKLKEKQFRLKFKHRVTPLTNPLELRVVRRDIARIETWLHERELQKGR
jgi:large subunit ribosomal protein L29